MAHAQEIDPMAFDDKKMTKLDRVAAPSSVTPQGSFWMYQSSQAIAAVIAAGFFNDHRGHFQTGDVILAVCSDGVAHLTVTLPAVVTDNITVTNKARSASGTHLTVTASDTVVTGLASVSVVVATLKSDPVLTCASVTATIGDQAGAPAAGSVYIKTWKPTGAGDTTPIAATTFGKSVNWIAFN